MPRPKKCRRICAPPACVQFGPSNSPAVTAEPVHLTLDEYEAIRLLDLEGMTQEDCARSMGVARTTVTAIYDSARHKLARFLIEGRQLEIGGGDVSLCAHRAECSRHCPHCSIQKECKNMKKIAVTYENGEVFQHFGHTEQFKIYEIENGSIRSSALTGTNGQGHGALGAFLSSLGVDTLICGGIGGGARQALAAANIALYPGVQGSADDAVAALLAGTLQYDPDTMCHHHDEAHGHGEGHNCHGHDHGHSCGGHCGH